MSSQYRASTRPSRERMLTAGVRALSDAEVLTVLLGIGLPERSAHKTSQQLLARFGALSRLLSALQNTDNSKLGLGTARWCILHAALELARRSIAEDLRRHDALTTPEAVGKFIALTLQHSNQEVFMVLFLDSRNRLLAAEEMFRGTLTQTAVYPREVIRRALDHNAAAVILAHNHPSGIPEPSQADQELTAALKQALGCLDIPVLDHLIVAGGRRFSFARHGLL